MLWMLHARLERAPPTPRLDHQPFPQTPLLELERRSLLGCPRACLERWLEALRERESVEALLSLLLARG